MKRPPRGDLESRHERFDLQPLDGGKVLDVAGEQRCLKLDGRGADQRIRQPQPVRQGQLINQYSRALRDGRSDWHKFSLTGGESLFQPRKICLVAATLRQLDVGHRRDTPGRYSVQPLGRAQMPSR